MSRWSGISYVAGCVALLIVGAVYVILGDWNPFLNIGLAVAVGCVGLGVAFDWRLYLEFFRLKTTKNGMNMGVLIVAAVTVLICVNFFSLINNKNFDFTTEKLFTLSDQTKKVLESAGTGLQITVFYKGAAGLAEKDQIRQVIEQYTDYDGKIGVQYYNTYKDLAESNDYLRTVSDKDSNKVFAFVEKRGKRIRVGSPFDENQFTSAIVKATRLGVDKVYFLKGHGERALDSDGPDGLKFLKEALESQAFSVSPLNLLETSEIPKDADFLAIVGPRTSYLPSELDQLRDYIGSGGRLLVAIDPGQNHHLGEFLKSYGIEFMNNYVVSLDRGGFTATAVGMIFSPTSRITEGFHFNKNIGFVGLDVASEVRAATDAPNGYHLDEILKSGPASLTATDLRAKFQDDDLKKMKSFSVAVEAEGAKNSEILAIGGSTFLSNQSFFSALNRDFALNSAADLARETDLIGVHPKSYNGTILDLSQYQGSCAVIAGIALPILFFLSSGVTWLRRRGL